MDEKQVTETPMAFDAKARQIQIQGRDYLPVPARVEWFRHDVALGRITTKLARLDDDIYYVHASIWVDDILMATGLATVRSAQGNREASWAGREIEKAETAAIGRALGFAGYGTVEDEGDYLADAPRGNQRQQDTTPDGETATTTITEIENGRTKAGKLTLILHTVKGNRIWMHDRSLFREAGFEVEEAAKPYLYGEQGERFAITPPLPIHITKAGDFWNVTGIDPDWYDDENSSMNMIFDRNQPATTSSDKEERMAPEDRPYGDDIPF